MFYVDPEICVGCGDCTEECPTGAIKVENDKAQIDPEECIDCGACQAVCPEEAIKEKDK